MDVRRRRDLQLLHRSSDHGRGGLDVRALVRRDRRFRRSNRSDVLGDFGFAVVLIGVGYFIVALDPITHRSIVVLGIGAKLFDVVVLTWRWYTGRAYPVVLIRPRSMRAGSLCLRSISTSSALGARP
jgi:hypothetical protein